MTGPGRDDIRDTLAAARKGTTTDTLEKAADLIHHDATADPLLTAVGDWLRAEVATQEAMPPLIDLFSLAIETAGGPKAYLTVGKRDDGEIAMHASTNEQALAVAAVVLERYAQ